MEIVVATTVFAITVTALLALFNYVMQINRRSEALRQTSQGMRNLMEFLVKEIRNGQVNYGYLDPGGTEPSALQFPCSTVADPSNYALAPGYGLSDNKLGLVDIDGNEVCIYYAKADNSYVGAGNFSSANGGVNLMLSKGVTLPPEVLNPPNFKVERLTFVVRPLKDPYAPGNLKLQPSVSIIAHFLVTLPTGERVPIYYQTSVSTNKYDIPNSP